LQAEAALPEEDDVDFFPDPEGGLSMSPTQSSVPSPPPLVSEAQVTHPSELTGLLQQLIQQQSEDRLAAEEARRASEARFAQLQQEVAHDHATADERFAGLLDHVTQW
jgi:predicted component of type VI protein secretion system